MWHRVNVGPTLDHGTSYKGKLSYKNFPARSFDEKREFQVCSSPSFKIERDQVD